MLYVVYILYLHYINTLYPVYRLIFEYLIHLADILSNGKLYQRYISKKHHLIPAASFCLPELDDVFLVQIISAILCMKKELPPV